MISIWIILFIFSGMSAFVSAYQGEVTAAVWAANFASLVLYIIFSRVFK